MIDDEPWSALRRFTQARIGLGRSGVAVPTDEVLRFALAHAQARDAVLEPMLWEDVAGGVARLGLDTMAIESAAPDRATYLRRPDLGRQLSASSRSRLADVRPHSADLVVVVGDGLSSKAVSAHAVAMIAALLPHISKAGWTLSPILLATQARVALGDEAAEYLGASAVLVLIGERPGLSSPDSLGAYLTFAPKVGRKDAERNCISNIRGGGLRYDEAAFKAAWLLKEAFRLGLTGVVLKDESTFAIEQGPGTRASLAARISGSS